MVLVWAYGAPASDYPERFLKNYWSEVQRKVANPARPSGQCLFPANGKGFPFASKRQSPAPRPISSVHQSFSTARSVVKFSSKSSGSSSGTALQKFCPQTERIDLERAMGTQPNADRA